MKTAFVMIVLSALLIGQAVPAAECGMNQAFRQPNPDSPGGSVAVWADPGTEQTTLKSRADTIGNSPQLRRMESAQLYFIEDSLTRTPNPGDTYATTCDLTVANYQ